MQSVRCNSIFENFLMQSAVNIASSSLLIMRYYSNPYVHACIIGWCNVFCSASSSGYTQNSLCNTCSKCLLHYSLMYGYSVRYRTYINYLLCRSLYCMCELVFLKRCNLCIIFITKTFIGIFIYLCYCYSTNCADTVRLKTF